MMRVFMAVSFALIAACQAIIQSLCAPSRSLAFTGGLIVTGHGERGTVKSGSLPLKRCVAGSRKGASPLLALAGNAGAGSNKYWWEETGGLPFECTGCGKCCRVKGDVWINPQEVNNLAAHLSLAEDDFAAQYVSRRVGGWVQLRDRGEGDLGCIFLGADNKTCGVYEARPLQCRTYPFFPRLLSTPEAWNGEVVTPEGEQGSSEWGGAERRWTPETGGCEGMKEVKGVRYNKKKGQWKVKQQAEPMPKDAPWVPADEVREALSRYEDYFLQFPHEFLLLNQNKRKSAPKISDEVMELLGAEPTEDSKPELLYDQLFAVSSLVKRELAQQQTGARPQNSNHEESSEQMEGDVDQEDGGFKAGYVSGQKGDWKEVNSQEKSLVNLVSDWATRHVIRLGLCPFAKPAMDTGKVRFKVASGVSDEVAAHRLLLEEANLIIQTPEETLPTTLIVFPDLHSKDFLEWNAFVGEIEDNLDEGGVWEEVGDHVLIAAFHPDFEFGGLDRDEKVLNFEKRAPVPIINLLRTAAIDRGIDRGVTGEKIAADNERTLLGEGWEGVREVYDDLNG